MEKVEGLKSKVESKRLKVDLKVALPEGHASAVLPMRRTSLGCFGAFRV